jgi:hypothetical protein
LGFPEAEIRRFHPAATYNKRKDKKDYKTFMNALVVFTLMLTGLMSEASPATIKTGQGNNPDAENILAVISKSRSTNSPAYRVVVRNDGSATAEIGSANVAGGSEPAQLRTFTAGSIDSQTLRRLLTQLVDVSAIPTGHCTKSVSFGTTTQITYEGKTSGDLQCVRRPAPGDDQARFQAAQDLARFVEEALTQLKVKP